VGGVILAARASRELFNTLHFIFEIEIIAGGIDSLDVLGAATQHSAAARARMHGLPAESVCPTCIRCPRFRGRQTIHAININHSISNIFAGIGVVGFD
jgi:hypothetical protein